jgi:hypothetical protein
MYRIEKNRFNEIAPLSAAAESNKKMKIEEIQKIS